jgi:hypothetical protein
LLQTLAMMRGVLTASCIALPADASPTNDLLLELGRQCPPGALRDVLAACEVATLLLLLLVPQTTWQTNATHAALFDRYQGVTGLAPPHLPDALFFALQSVVIAVAHGDLAALRSLQVRQPFLFNFLLYGKRKSKNLMFWWVGQSELWAQLEPHTNELLHQVICAVASPV